MKKMHRNLKVIIKVLVGCCASAFLMEVLMTRATHCTNLITFLQFLFISAHGLIFTTKFFTVKPKVPLQHYVLLIALFFVTSVSNNYVYALHVPSTLHMIIRSASSPASMIVAWYYKKRPPRLNNAIGSVLITTGVVIAMYGGATVAEQNKGQFIYWCIGVSILLATLVTGALSGLQQEIIYARYGKHADEMMFYLHSIPLPFFITLYPQMSDAVSTLHWDVWGLIAINILSQFYCTVAVHELATKETSVTVTFILTVKKFASLIISSIVFKNNLTVFHVLGTFLVIIGTYIYFDFFTNRQQRSVTMKDR